MDDVVVDKIAAAVAVKVDTAATGQLAVFQIVDVIMVDTCSCISREHTYAVDGTPGHVEGLVDLVSLDDAVVCSVYEP